MPSTGRPRLGGHRREAGVGRFQGRPLYFLGSTGETDRKMIEGLEGGEFRVAVVGCGTMAEKCHLPALERSPGRRVAALVDRDEGRARALARVHGGPAVFSNHQDLIEAGGVDGAIVAVPPGLHAAISQDLMCAGIPVLVEKPVAVTLAECDAMARTAEESGVILAVGFMRRFAPQLVLVKRLLEEGALGPIHRIELREGSIFHWPAATDFLFRRDQAGGGVLIDLGVHSVDLLIWWMGGVTLLEYRDNDGGGVESDCLMKVRLPSGSVGELEFSRTRQLRGTAILVGERGRLEVDLVENRVDLSLSKGYHLVGEVQDDFGSGVDDHVALIAAEHDDWVNAVVSGTSPSVTAAEARRSLALILEAYERRKPLDFPWFQPLSVKGGAG
jgi:predicted dehydrogenase